MFSSTWLMEGFWHPLQTPSQLILLVSLAVLLGQQNKLTLPKIITAFVGFLCLGFVINHFYPLAWDVELLLLIVALGISLLVTLRLKLSVFVLLPIILLSGLVLGLDSKPIMIPGFGNNIMYNWLVGVLVSMMSLGIMVGLTSYVLRNLGNGIVLRVIGSWIATSALFVLTLMLVKP